MTHRRMSSTAPQRLRWDGHRRFTSPAGAHSRRHERSARGGFVLTPSEARVAARRLYGLSTIAKGNR